MKYSTNFNSDRGESGESLSRYIFDTCINGQSVPKTLRGEGKGALDFDCNWLLHYVQYKIEVTVGIQVKTGNSYTEWRKTQKHWSLSVEKEHIQNWRGTNRPIIILWVKNHRKKEVYWQLVDRNSNSQTIYIPPSHVLTPASRFDIERKIINRNNPGAEIHLGTLSLYKTRKEATENGKAIYKQLRKEYKTQYGNIFVTNYGWEHMNRQGRKNKFVITSCSILKFIPELLKSNPHVIHTTRESIRDNGNLNGHSKLVKNKVLFIFKNVRFDNIKEPKTVYIRLQEILTYPENWKETALIDKSLQHYVRLESIYYK